MPNLRLCEKISLCLRIMSTFFFQYLVLSSAACDFAAAYQLSFTQVEPSTAELRRQID